MTGIAAGHLRSLIERLERLHEEREAIADDIKGVYAEAKGNGFDVKVLKEVLKIRRQDKSEREEHEAVLDLYLEALGMAFDLPDERSLAPAPAGAGAGAPERMRAREDDITVQVVVDGTPSAPVPLGLLNKIVDASQTDVGRAVLGAALDAVRTGGDAGQPVGDEIGF